MTNKERNKRRREQSAPAAKAVRRGALILRESIIAAAESERENYGPRRAKNMLRYGVAFIYNKKYPTLSTGVFNKYEAGLNKMIEANNKRGE
tara:strand:- start:4134 stop:4409 length:276 start_codon:yes stop_codon:yes gene_type:complete